jgi:hypothetical protein
MLVLTGGTSLLFFYTIKENEEKRLVLRQELALGGQEFLFLLTHPLRVTVLHTVFEKEKKSHAVDVCDLS